MPTELLSRKNFIRLSASSLGAFLLSWYPDFLSRQESTNWPTEPDAILTKIRELAFTPGSKLSSTITPRKIMWEIAQVRKAQQTWSEDARRDESKWMEHQEIIASSLSLLAENGISGGRLAIFSYELTDDGVHFDWSPMETAIDLMRKHGMSVDLCLGPLDYPEGPGIRLPVYLQDMVRDEAKKQGVHHIHISQDNDLQMPRSSEAIRAFAYDFCVQQLERYGQDERIEKFYIGNEWPDPHGIENVEGVTMSIGENFMKSIISIVQEKTQKPIGINTNIHPSQVEKIQKELGGVIRALGENGFLGFDTYPTQEAKEFWLRRANTHYGELIGVLHHLFPATAFVFTEMQGEPWPERTLAGKSWVDIFTTNPEVITQFYENQFAPTLETNLIASRIAEVGVWGIPAMLVFSQLGYTFPLELMKAIADAMGKEE